MWSSVDTVQLDPSNDWIEIKIHKSKHALGSWATSFEKIFLYNGGISRLVYHNDKQNFYQYASQILTTTYEQFTHDFPGNSEGPICLIFHDNHEYLRQVRYLESFRFIPSIQRLVYMIDWNVILREDSPVNRKLVHVIFCLAVCELIKRQVGVAPFRRVRAVVGQGCGSVAACIFCGRIKLEKVLELIQRRGTPGFKMEQDSSFSKHWSASLIDSAHTKAENIRLFIEQDEIHQDKEFFLDKLQQSLASTRKLKVVPEAVKDFEVLHYI